MESEKIRQKYLDFFKSKNHVEIPSASLVPMNDPTVLFNTAGMQPLVPYFTGPEHPQGKRLVNYQRCLRTVDINEVGDNTHLTLFEMLGNWSLGDYWKEESINWSYEFLTHQNWLALDKDRLSVTIFAGNDAAPFDSESFEIWKSLGFSENRIAKLSDNWWGPPGVAGPCGFDTEIFYWTGEGQAPQIYNPEDARWVEVWNNVFILYEKTIAGEFIPLQKKSIDTGMGFERICAVLAGKTNFYETDVFQPIMEKIQSLATSSDIKAERVIADHIRAATFMIADGILPSNKDRGYILRRLIRRAITYAKKIGIEQAFTSAVSQSVVDKLSKVYPHLINPKIAEELGNEETKFRQTLSKGLKILESKENITGKEAFDLFQSYGFPFELTMELGKVQNPDEFQEEFKKHQDLSRTASAGQFKGGLASHSEQSVKLHTATHLLNAALRKVLGGEVWQKGSNITDERTRFDFTHAAKVTDEQKVEIERLVNDWISRDLPVVKTMMTQDEAKKAGAIGVFGEKYAETVSIYKIQDPGTGEVISQEFCGGPHVERTGVIGQFKIQKEEAVSAGVRRMKAVIS